MTNDAISTAEPRTAKPRTISMKLAKAREQIEACASTILASKSSSQAVRDLQAVMSMYPDFQDHGDHRKRPERGQVTFLLGTLDEYVLSVVECHVSAHDAFRFVSCRDSPFSVTGRLKTHILQAIGRSMTYGDGARSVGDMVNDVRAIDALYDSLCTYAREVETVTL